MAHLPPIHATKNDCKACSYYMVHGSKTTGHCYMYKVEPNGKCIMYVALDRIEE